MISAHLLEWCFLGALSLLVGGIVFYRQWQSELDVDLTQADLTAALQTEEGARLLWRRAEDVVHALEWCGTHERISSRTRRDIADCADQGERSMSEGERSMKKHTEAIYERMKEDLAALAGCAITESSRREKAEERAAAAEERVRVLEAKLGKRVEGGKGA